MNVKDSEIKHLMEAYKKMTVIGINTDVEKPAHKVPVYLKSKGYDIVGVHPRSTEVAGMKVYQKLSDVPLEYRKFVDVFRKPEAIPEIVDEILAVGGVELLWLQLGITHPEAEARAEAAGIKVISNRCTAIEYKKYF